MEVSGKRKERKSFSASRGSAEDFLLFCIPCDSEGIREPAHGYCKNCKEHLCETCFKHHKKPAPLRNHVLLDKDSMPKVPSVSNTQDDLDHCPEHEDKKLEFYCKEHSKIVCGVCVPLSHRMCKVEYIPKLSKNILEEDELPGLLVELTTFQDACKSKIEKSNNNIKATAENHERLLKEIKHFRKELNEVLDEMELKITKEADRVMTAHQEVLQKSSFDLEDIRKEIEVYLSRLDKLKHEKHLDKLFVEMKTTQKQLKKISHKEIASSPADELRNLGFVGNKSILEMLQSQRELGNLIQAKNIDSTAQKRQDSDLSATSSPSEYKTVLLKSVDEIDVRSQSDVKEPNITGLEYIKQNRLVVCDEINLKVKCYDTVKRKIVAEIKLENYPFDVTTFTDNKIAVTVPDERCIYLMSVTSTSITTDKMINIKQRCSCIAYSQNKLVVSCCIGKVLIINLYGEILQTFCGDICCYPYHITTNSAGTSLFLSDFGYKVDAVQKLDWQGNVVKTYDPSKYGKRLRGRCELDDGTFLVCQCINDKNNILRLSKSCKPCKVTGQEKVGKWFPQAVTYCKETRMLFVSCSKKSAFDNPYHIKFFKVDWG